MSGLLATDDDRVGRGNFRLSERQLGRGLKALREKRTFERVRRAGLGWFYLAFGVLEWVFFAVSMRVQHDRKLDSLFLLCALAFTVLARANWQQQRARYRRNCRVVKRLERRCGSDLREALRRELR